MVRWLDYLEFGIWEVSRRSGGIFRVWMILGEVGTLREVIIVSL